MESLEINQTESLQKDLEGKIFARCCQLIDTKGKSENNTMKISIPFTAYDAIEDRIINGDYFNEVPYFVDDSLKNKIVLMRILEEFTDSEQTPIKDILGAVINPNLCLNKSLSTEENKENETLDVILSSWF